MIAELGGGFGMRREITLDVILRDLLELVVRRICGGNEDRQRQRTRDRKSDSHSTLARGAAVQNRFGGDFVRRKLRLQISPPFVETSHDNEDDGGAKHQPGEEHKVLICAELMPCAQNPFIDQTDEKLT